MGLLRVLVMVRHGYGLRELFLPVNSCWLAVSADSFVRNCQLFCSLFGVVDRADEL